MYKITPQTLSVWRNGEDRERKNRVKAIDLHKHQPRELIEVLNRIPDDINALVGFYGYHSVTFSEFKKSKPLLREALTSYYKYILVNKINHIATKSI